MTSWWISVSGLRNCQIRKLNACIWEESLEAMHLMYSLRPVVYIGNYQFPIHLNKMGKFSGISIP